VRTVPGSEAAAVDRSSGQLTDPPLQTPPEPTRSLNNDSRHTADGEHVVVPRCQCVRPLARQRISPGTTMCSGPGDWPLITLFDDVPVRWE
jgi:hypothetical protein